MKQPPTLDDYVAAFLTHMRAPLKSKTISTSARTMRVRQDGEVVLYGPRGEPIRVRENTEHGTQVEHGDHLHAVVRPHVVTRNTATN